MKNILYFLLITSVSAFAKNSLLQDSRLCFIENKGQVTDQLGKKRTDIDILLRGEGLNVFAGNGMLHYQFHRIVTIDDSENRIATYRVDMALANANKNSQPILLEQQEYHERYYTPQFGEQGGLVHSFNKVMYKDIYPGIDWILYVKNNKLEQDFIVHEGADPGQIQLQYSGASSIAVNSDGSFTVYTPMGVLTETAPHCFTAEGKLHSSYRLRSNIISFDVASYKGTLTIDPTVIWGTYYYAASTAVQLSSIQCPTPSDIYMAGSVSPDCLNMATAGVYQDTITGSSDAILARFDSSGSRIWATYYGGSQQDAIMDLDLDDAGNLYVCGGTRSTSGMASTGGYDQSFDGIEDGFIAKFTNTGQRVWGTYYGGTALDQLREIATDHFVIYVGGVTASNTNISSPNAHQTIFGGGTCDNMLLKFDSAGNRLWSTYYGGSSDEHTFSYITIDGLNNVYLTGRTISNNNISSTGSYQDTWQGLYNDAYLVKFDSAGQRIWGTYYGGDSSDAVIGIAADASGAVYIAGSTASTNNISTPGSIQETKVGIGQDIFITKFTASGQRVWGTYYGNEGLMNFSSGRSLASDKWNNIYLTGMVDSAGHPGTTPNVMQETYGGGWRDGFITKLDSSGALLWASYYGGSGQDAISALCPDNIGNIYFCGYSYSNNGIATPGSFVDSNPNLEIAPFIVKVYDTAYPVSISQRSLKNSIHIYPNPTKGIFELYSSEAGVCEIYNIDGRSLYRKNVKSGMNVIQLPHSLPRGIYIVKCTLSGGDTYAGRLVLTL